LGYREYAKDFEIEYVERPGKKRPKAVRIYVGPYFQLKVSAERVRWLKRFYLACLLACASLLLIPMCIDCAFTRIWYIQVPAAAAFIPWLLAADSVWRLWTAKDRMEREHADLIHDRMSSSCLFLMGFFGISCIGCALRMGSGTVTGSDWLVSLCYAAGLLCSCAMFAKRKELEMNQLENPEKPRAKSKTS
jgi:hypothetical protein